MEVHEEPAPPPPPKKQKRATRAQNPIRILYRVNEVKFNESLYVISLLIHSILDTP